MKPRKWAKEIKAWADGEVIEERHPLTGKWIGCGAEKTPDFYSQLYEFRIKPPNPKFKVWTCKIVIEDRPLPLGFDAPPRNAAEKAIEDANFKIISNFSGWGGELTIHERIIALNDFNRIIEPPEMSNDCIKEPLEESQMIKNEAKSATLLQTGKDFVKLGKALKRDSTNMADIAVLAAKCGLDFQFRFAHRGIELTNDEVLKDEK